jgi:hypothetical protein
MARQHLLQALPAEVIQVTPGIGANIDQATDTVLVEQIEQLILRSMARTDGPDDDPSSDLA